MTDEKNPGEPSGQDLVEQLKASGQLDALFAQIDACLLYTSDAADE